MIRNLIVKDPKGLLAATMLRGEAFGSFFYFSVGLRAYFMVK